MQLLDFSNEPFITVCEKDVSYTYDLTGHVSSTVEINECRNPFYDFVVLGVFILAFIVAVSKVSCMVSD